MLRRSPHAVAAAFCAGLAFAPPSFAQSAPGPTQSVLAGAGVLSERNVSVALAAEAAAEALANCTAQGYRVAVAVADRSGHLKALLRGDGAGPHLIDAARRKAYTAASSRSPTLAWAENLKKGTGVPDPNLIHLEGILMVGGGVPIRAGEEVVGAIGVGGAPGGDKDHACAEAGIAKIRDRLI